MPSLDLYTVRVMTLITVLMSSTATLFAWRANKSVLGMRWFCLGFLSMSIGSVLGMGAALGESYWLMIASWAGRFAGMIMVAQSIRMFRGFPLWSPTLIAVFAVTVSSLFSWWIFGRDDMAMRIGVISSAMAILTADAAYSMFSHVSRRDRLTHWATGFVFAFIAVCLGVRGVANLSGASRSGAFSAVSVEIIATIAAHVAFIGAAFGMLLASNALLRRAAESNAMFDSLTGLPNRRYFEERLQEAEVSAHETGRQVGIIYVDIDEFKQVNDTRGHQAGDELLRRASAAMLRVLRQGDCLARVGGDEFVILAEDVGHRSQLVGLVDRLSAAIEETPEPGHGPATRASYGAALFPDDGATIRDVMREADSDMYHAKRRRRQKARAANQSELHA